MVVFPHLLAYLKIIAPIGNYYKQSMGMTRDRKDDDAIQKALEAAVQVILRSQNPGGGWRYQPRADGGEDTSCTQTVFHALASARQAGIVVPNETITKPIGRPKTKPAPSVSIDPGTSATTATI